MIQLRCDPRSTTAAPHLYRVAGVSLRADRPLAWLSAFGTAEDPSAGPPQEFDTGTLQAEQTGLEGRAVEMGTPSILPPFPRAVEGTPTILPPFPRGVEGGTPSILNPFPRGVEGGTPSILNASRGVEGGTPSTLNASRGVEGGTPSILNASRGVEGGTPSILTPDPLRNGDGVGGDAPQPGDVLFSGRAYLARRDRDLICRRLPATFRLEVEDLGLFEYHPAESLIEVAAASPNAPPDLLEEVLLGPLLALALARRDIFLLHASGCEIGGNAYLFLGESGAGKSTLAARLAARGGLLLADDQAAIGAVRLELLPDFPQPKLDPARQQPLAGASARPIAGIFLLAAAPADAEPAIEDLSPLEAAAGLLRHTTAARCFDHPLLRAHLDFAAALAGRVPCRRLFYPHHQDAPKKIGALLAP